MLTGKRALSSPSTENNEKKLFRIPQELQSGKDGTIYKPPYDCIGSISTYKNSKNDSKNNVGKIYTNTEQTSPELLHEIAFAKIMDGWRNTIDDNRDLNNYFVMPIKSCNTSEGVQLIMPDAGKDMMDIFFPEEMQFIPCKRWFEIILNVIEAIKIMHDNGYVHCDVKLENILFDDNIARLADFGLSCSFEEFKESASEREPYYLTPPEFFTNNNKKEAYYNALKNMGTTTLNETLYDALHNDGIFKSTNYSNYMELYDAEKYDIYSLGIVCVRIHNMLDFKNTTVKKKDAYIEFIKKLIASDFKERATVDEARAMCKELIQPEPSQTGGGSIKRKENKIKSLQLKIKKLQDKIRHDKDALKEVEKSLKEAKKASKKKRQ